MNQENASIGPSFFADKGDDKGEDYITIIRKDKEQAVLFKGGCSCVDISASSFYQSDMMNRSRNAGIFTKSNKIPAKENVNTKNRFSQLSDDLFCNTEMDELNPRSEKSSGKSSTIYSSPLYRSLFCRVLLCIFAVLLALLLICTAVLLVLYFSSDKHSDLITFTTDLIQKSLKVLSEGQGQRLGFKAADAGAVNS